MISMSAELRRQFVDTNIFVYAYDESAGAKHDKARALLLELLQNREGCLSMQVLQELFVSLTRKLREPLDSGEAARRVRYLSEWTLHIPDRSDLFSAMDLHRELHISFWDAMLIQSARRLNCRVLWTEDFSNGRSYAGVTARNPFLEMVMEEAEPYGEAAKR
jgi:predicted nucleic acid-binding protein